LVVKTLVANITGQFRN